MLIKNGTIHDGLGNVKAADLRLQDGLIQTIGADLTPLADEDVFDATGMEILPGFVQAISNWGVNGSIQEIRPSSNDNDEHSNPIMPEMDAFYAFNGRAAMYQQLGAFGLTACGVAPTDNNLFGGTIAAFTTEGLNPYKMCLKRGIAMMSSVTPNLKRTYAAKMAPQTRMWIFTTLANQLRLASEYNQEEGKPADEKLAALKKVVTGELPLFVSCDSALAAERVHEITSAYPELKLVLVNGFGLTGEENWIIEKKIPIVARSASMPMDKDAMTLSLPAMAKFMEQGVPVVLGGCCTNHLCPRESMIWDSAQMMKVLHDADKVLPLVTSEPAKLLGIDDQTGSIREGLRADIVIWSANPLETYRAHIVRTYLVGQVIYQEGDEMKCM